MRKPDFLIIGAQKCGTTWLWEMLKDHPDIGFPAIKEIHFWGGSENYRKGIEWYYDFFKDIEPGKLTGEASPSYLYDRLPYWYNDSNDLEHDDSLPTIPELVHEALPDVKLIAILRNPVARAISAYHHHLRFAALNGSKMKISPFWSLKKVALQAPKTRLLPNGYYSKYLKAWMDVFPREQFKIYFFEEAILKDRFAAILELFDFLGIDRNYTPPNLNQVVHGSWGWFSILAGYLLPNLLKRSIINNNQFLRYLDRTAWAKSLAVKEDDLAFLKNQYKDEKEQLELLLGRPVPWAI